MMMQDANDELCLFGGALALFLNNPGSLSLLTTLLFFTDGLDYRLNCRLAYRQDYRMGYRPDYEPSKLSRPIY